LKILVNYLINSLIARFKRENNNGNNEFNKIDTDYQNNFSDNNNLGSDSSNFSYNSSDPMFSNVKHDNEETSTPKKPRTKKPKINAQNNGELDLFNKAKYQLPSVSLLQQPSSYTSYETIPKEELLESAERLKTVLKEFGVEGEIVDVRPGPVITLYELEPAPGLRAGRVISLAEDIARSMSVISARVAIVPGRNIIGIELPNEHRNVVYLNEILNTKEFIQSKHTLALALGKNIGGEPVIVDLPSMPHLLVAGTTGSGKSVGINTIILSLLYRYTPDECKLIMIDPKMLELSVYDGIPHLLSPVVTEPKKAVVALKWTLTEMERRYKNMAKLGVRNIIGFNDKIKKSIANGEIIKNTVQLGFDLETGKPNYVTEEMKLQTMPYIVVIVDEMADLMAVAGKEVDMTISRLAAMARAAGIHIIMATQRPSTDVITGVIKSNLPTRISFQVSSKIDSRVVLGESGAEQLLGKGDMLYMASGGRINRVHGAFVDDYEVENVVNFLKKQAQPEYIAEITIDTSANDSMYNSQNSNDEKQAGEDHLYDKAIEVVSMDRKASTSYIQRKLSIGYNRAATIIERMEEDGIVGPADHAGRREILLPEHNYDKI
jgi:DNA segregation ATPase FtsK/SpoIIIE, S-DNA-T family